MTDAALRTSPARRPVVVTIGVVLVYVAGFLDVAAGLVILLSRYQAAAGDILPVSLLGAGTILFGLLTVAVASGIARGSRFARLILTLYAAARFALHVVTIVTTDWDGLVVVQMAAGAYLLLVLWTPPGRRWFRRGVSASRP